MKGMLVEISWHLRWGSGYQTVVIPVQIDEVRKPIQVALDIDERVGSEVVVSASKRPEKITNAPASIQVIATKDSDNSQAQIFWNCFQKCRASNIRDGVSMISLSTPDRNGGLTFYRQNNYG